MNVGYLINYKNLKTDQCMGEQKRLLSCRAVKMAEKLNLNFALKYDQYSNYIGI